MSRLALLALGFPLLAISAPPVSAQTMPPAQTARPPDKIDIRVDTTPEAGAYEDCEEDQDAAIITGEIIVCRRRSDEENRLYDKETAERRHAEETAFKKDPRGPDFLLDCNDQGWPPGCFRMGKVPPPAYLIDFSKLPETPPGSDADRIGRGLAPRGNDSGTVTPPPAPEQGQQDNAEVLGLPPPLDADGVSRSGSASPEDAPSG